MGASPVSPQAATEAAVTAMRSMPLVSTGTDAREAQTHGIDLPLAPVVSNQREFDPVPVIERSPVASSSAREFDSVSAPVSTRTPTGMTTTVLLPAIQEPLYAPIPEPEPTVIDGSLTASSNSFQPADLPVAMPPQAAVERSMMASIGSLQPANLPVAMPLQAPTGPRPVGAFSYTALAAPSGMPPPSTDRYIPAIGFSPSRTRVARDPPPDSLGHIRKQSHTMNTLPILPQQGTSLPRGDAAVGYRQEISPYTPAVSANTVYAAPMDMRRTDAQSTGAVYGPGVTSTPLAPDRTVNHPAVSMTSAPVDIVTQAAPTIATYTAVAPAPPTGHVVNPTAQMHATDVSPLYAAQLPSPVVSSQGGWSPSGGLGPVGVVPGGSQYQGSPGGLVPGSQEAAGPLQAGQTMTPGPVGEGTEPSLQASGSDSWSDGESVMADALPQTWQERSAQSGPVCEGVETNSDVWSDSASFDPGTPISSSQAVVRSRC